MHTIDHLEAWLRLSFQAGISSRIVHPLLQHFGSAQAVVDASPTALKSMRVNSQLITQLKKPVPDLLKQTEIWLAEKDHHLLTLGSPNYPDLLKQIPDPPLLLYIWGNPEVLASTQIAMVGSRNPSAIGTELAYEYASELCKLHITVTSGMALGIDAASHQGALAANGQTIGVLGSGLSCIYPSRHRELAAMISQQGAVVSEFALHAKPIPIRFPRRNRIISGLSLGTLVVEATLRSGSLITAHLAVDQGRDVFAIPGSPHNPLSRGCHQLIQQGAKLVTCAADITQELTLPEQMTTPALKQNPQAMSQAGLEQNDIKLLECIQFEATAVDQLVERSQFCAADVTSILLNLELHGYIKPCPGGYIRVIR